MKKYLVPSLLSANFYNLENDLNILKKSGISIIHLDIMDGLFVSNLSIGIPVVESLNEYFGDDFIFDTHLMIEKPERYIDNFKRAGSDIITIHAEATSDMMGALSLIKEKKAKAGISIVPETDVKILEPVLGFADLILIMSVHPGFGGQAFMEDTLDKVKYLEEKRKENNYNYIIEMDGGIGTNNIDRVLKSGVDYVVAGSAVFKGDIESNIKSLNKVIGAYNE